jgi:two-component system, response regulator
MRNHTILLVEDNADDEALTIRALEQHGVVGQVARDGAEALDVLLGGDHDGQLPELVLLDLKLPKVDGLEVLRRIRADERTAQLPVVVLTASTEESDVMKSYAGGATSFVSKPVDFQQFSEAVRKLATLADGTFSTATIRLLAALCATEPPPRSTS